MPDRFDPEIDFDDDGENPHAWMEPNARGDYVEYNDWFELDHERQVLEKRVEELEGILREIQGMAMI